MKFLLAMHGQFMVHGSSLCCIVHCALCVGGGRGKRQEGVEPARPECVEKVPAISEAPAIFSYRGTVQVFACGFRRRSVWR